MSSDSRERSSLTREELYKRVWSTPMHKLAPCFGLSDVGFKKLCDRYKVPTPPRGYWAKKRVGKVVRRTPLPVERNPALQVIDLRYDPAPKPPEKPAPPRFPVNDPELIALVERERDPKFQITVPDNLRNPHPVAARLRDAFAGELRPDQYNLMRPRSGDDWVNVAVGKHSVLRALRVVNALFLALERRGWVGRERPAIGRGSPKTDGVRCSVLGEDFGLMLREKLRMIRLSPEERKDRHFDPWVRYEPTGSFELRITHSHTHRYPIDTWKDGKKARVEDQLNDVVIGLLVAVERNRERREEQRREEERRRVAEAVRREQERREQLERERVARFEALAERWERTKRLQVFLDAVKTEFARRQTAPDAELGFARWLKWAEEHVRTVDPLAQERPLPVY